MINVRKLVRVAKVADTSSGGLAIAFRRNTLLNTVSRTKLFKEEEKLQKLREDTFSALSKTLGEKGKKGGLSTVLISALGLGGAGRIIRGFRGGGGGGFRGGGGPPKLPRGPLAKSLSKFGRIGPLAIASTGLDFFSRKQSGQSNLQAGGGALAGLGGFAGGAKLGAMLGTAIMPGVGTAAGGILGGAVGGLFGGNLFDRLYGQNTLRAGADFRRIQELDRTRQGKTLFGENLDKLENVLDKFENNVSRSKFDEDFQGFIAARIRGFGERVKKTARKPTPALMRLVDTLFNALIVVEAGATKRVPTITPALKLSLKNYLMSSKAQKASKAKLLFSPRQSTFLDFSKDASKIKPELPLIERMTRAFKKNFPRGFKPQLSRKGINIREQARLTKELKQIEKNIPEFEIYDFLKKVKLQSPDLIKSDLKRAYVRDYEIIMKRYKQNKIGVQDLLEQTDDLRKTYNFEADMVDRYGIEVKQIFEAFKKIKKDSPQADSLFKGLFRDIKKIPKKFPELKEQVILNQEGGIMSGPDTGYLAVLHGKERIIPEENQYTRSKGQSQGMKQNIFIFQDGNNNNNIQPQQEMQTPKTQIVPIFVPADPFDVATKYSELIAKVTV